MEEMGWKVVDKLNAKTKTGVDKHGEMYAKEGRLLKPHQGATKTRLEVEAFAQLGTTELSKYIPTFYGITEYSGTAFLEMEDVFCGLEEPFATCDIKMGKKTYSDNASDEKKAKESKKIYPGKCSEIGFRAVGLSCLEHSLHHTEIVERKDLTPTEFNDLVLRKFFSSSNTFDGSISCDINYFISELEEILRIIKSGYGGILRASSILLARRLVPNSSQSVVKLIDFANFTPTEGIDTNLVEGLEALLSCFYQVRDSV
eukprot:TRINITY_DN30935_c0_g1_i1.p1 TRINITY_DN30935_c0_g1~~TRINITY_DN30935_c0_g1_i1.p1  ORF type:complete len:258 (+),score=33.26 TRINITY_DN30935_c0_g1_i1:49-822(+)